jgi:hypothetical protein
MKSLYRHVVNGFLLCALWTPLLWLVSTLCARYAPQTAVWQLSWWEIALLVALIALPARATLHFHLNPARNAGHI